MSKRVLNAEAPIGVFDSGIGGLTVVRQLHRAMPREEIVYLGDTARVPYGTKSPETIIRYAREDAAFLLGHRVKALVVACNSASAWALPALQGELEVPVFGVIAPGSASALARTRNGRIGVIGTAATIRSHAYRRGLEAQAPSVRVFERACPLLVPLVEEGWVNQGVTRDILRAYLVPLVDRGIDTLILGCTHYPLLRRSIQAVVSRSVALVDSAQACAAAVRGGLEADGLLKRRGQPRGRIRPFVTDPVEQFARVANRFLGVATEIPQRVELPIVH